MKPLNGFTKRRILAFVGVVVASVVALSVSTAPVSSREAVKAKALIRPTAIDWSTRHYSPEPPLDATCDEPNLNVILLVDRSEDIVDSDRRNAGNLTEELYPGTIATYENSLVNGIMNTWLITSNMYSDPTVGGKVNFYVYAYATNVVAQFDGTDSDGDGIVDTPDVNTTDLNGDGVVVPKPVTEITDKDVKELARPTARIYYRGTGDPESKSSSPTDIKRGYGTTSSPQGTGQNNWANALAFATNMVSQKYDTASSDDDIDIVYLTSASNPNQNAGYNQVPNLAGDHDLGVYSATNFGFGGLNNTGGFTTLPHTVLERDVRYKPSRDSDIWHAANVVEALRSGNPVAELGTDPVSGSSERPGLAKVRNPVQVDTFLGGRFPDYGPADKVLGQDRYLTARDFRKSFTGDREGGWLRELCGGGTSYDFSPDVSVVVGTGLPATLREGTTGIATFTVRNRNPQFAIHVPIDLTNCGGAQQTLHFNVGETIKTIPCPYSVPLGYPSNTFDMKVAIADTPLRKITVDAPSAGWIVKPNIGLPPFAETSATVERIALPA